MKLSKCRLCLKEKRLCKSHIYPEYMYKSCYDDNHSYTEFNADEQSFNKRRRKGLYENLFCRECEGIFQRYEDYAKSLIYDEAKPEIKLKLQAYSTANYNYTKFKLFILSLLWRASVSSLDGLKLANLGKYEEDLRVILFKGLETKVNNYPCLLYQTHIGHTLSDGVFMEIFSGKAKADGRTIYQFIIDGLYIFIGVGVCSIESFRQGSSVNPERLRIGYDELSKVSALVDIFCRLSQQGKFSQYENNHNPSLNPTR